MGLAINRGSVSGRRYELLSIFDQGIQPYSRSSIWKEECLGQQDTGIKNTITKDNERKEEKHPERRKSSRREWKKKKKIRC